MPLVDKFQIRPLITQRSQVQILPPLLRVRHGSRFPKGAATCALRRESAHDVGKHLVSKLRRGVSRDEFFVAPQQIQAAEV